MDSTEAKNQAKIRDAIEAVIRSPAVGLYELCRIYGQTYQPFLEPNHLQILVGCIEINIMLGKTDDTIVAANLAPLLALQLGNTNVLTKQVLSFLLNTALNKRGLFPVRTTYCRTLGLHNFFVEKDTTAMINLMNDFERIFGRSYPDENDETPKGICNEEADLQTEALCAWGLLFTKISSEDFEILHPKIIPSLDNVFGLLKSVHLNVRRAAAEIIALIVEKGRSSQKDFASNYTRLLSQSLIDATKKIQETQATIFLDIRNYIETNYVPMENINLDDESLTLNTWSLKFKYDRMCDVAGNTIKLHLQCNVFLRTFFVD